MSLTNIRNKSTGVEHLARPSSLFQVSADGIVVLSNSGAAVDSVSNPSPAHPS
jgi:hypothetical protein